MDGRGQGHAFLGFKRGDVIQYVEKVVQASSVSCRRIKNEASACPLVIKMRKNCKKWPT